ncbi:MAG: hypothetical protein PHI32_13790 [Dysgonamonadaceae bacterium]|nr:hypothetical protein [Dysgonamonadaceae bacterium]
MKKIIDNVAKLLMYNGPDINELIAVAVMENKKVEIDEKENLTILKNTFETAYNSIVTDIFTFNSEKELIKQEVQINHKVKVIFDKYAEAKELLDKLPNNDLLAS